MIIGVSLPVVSKVQTCSFVYRPTVFCLSCAILSCDFDILITGKQDTFQIYSSGCI